MKPSIAMTSFILLYIDLMNQYLKLLLIQKLEITSEL